MAFMKQQTAIVTGGAGFIGSHLTETLLQSGYRAIVVDDLSSGKLDNIPAPESTKHLQFIQTSITDLRSVREAFNGADYVFHLAALPSVPRSIKDPLASHEMNATGTLNGTLTRYPWREI